MKKFTQFLEQRDPELYEQMNRRDFFKDIGGWGGAAAILSVGGTLGGIGLKKITEKPKIKSNNTAYKNNHLILTIDHSAIGDKNNWKPDENTEGWKFKLNNYTDIEAKKEARKMVVDELINRNSDFEISGNNKNTKISKKTRSPVKIGRIFIDSKPYPKENYFIVTVIHDNRPFSLGFDK